MSIVSVRATGGTGAGVQFMAGNAVTNGAFRNNVVFHCSPGAGTLQVKGTETDTIASTNNILHVLDKANGAADPTLGTGATLTWGSNTGAQLIKAAGAQLALGDTHASALTCAGNRSTETIRLRNNSANHMRLETAAAEWAIAISSANLAITQITGDGMLTSNKAIQILGGNGSLWTHGFVSELVTLSTSGTTTDSTNNLLPANSIIEAVVARVTTTITTATDWQLGDPTTAGRFTAAISTLTAGTTTVGLVHIDQSGAAGPRQTSAAKVRITTTGTPGAGAIRVTVFYRQFTAPTS